MVWTGFEPVRWLRAVVRFVFGKQLPLERETCLFILASAIDAFMTYVILRHSADGRTSVVLTEGNAVARYFLYHWGIKGLVAFKFTMVAATVVVAQVIALRRKDLARWVLNVGTGLVCVVIGYSLWLLLRTSL